MPSRDQSLTVGNLDAVNPFERQHAPGGTVPVNGGNDIARLRHHRFGQLRSGCGLSAQIKLTRGPALHIRNHLAWAQAGCFPSQQFQMRSEEHTSELQSLIRISYAVFCLKKKQPSSVT